MTSLYSFKESLKDLPVQVSMLFMERLTAIVRNTEECTLGEAVAAVLESLGHSVESVGVENVERICNRVMEIQESRSQPASSGKKPTKTRKGGYGDSYKEFLDGLNPWDHLTLVCNFDVEKASHLYGEVDFDIADSVIALWLKRDWALLQSQMEAVVYGNGGKMKGGPSGGENSEYYDLTGGCTPENLALLRTAGF